jgi:hypothetical protein
MRLLDVSSEDHFEVCEDSGMPRQKAVRKATAQ